MALMGRAKPITTFPKPVREACLALAAGAAVLSLARWLRSSPYIANPQVFKDLQIACAMMALTFASTALVRFRAMRDRISLFLALGFLLAGGVIASTLWLQPFSGQPFDPGAVAKSPVHWWLSRALLAVLLLVALLLEKRAPSTAKPGREIAMAILITAGAAVLFSVIYEQMPIKWTVLPKAFISRPWNLILAAVYLVAAVGFRRRLRDTDSAYDRGLFLAASLNVACHLAACQSEELMDAPFVFAQVLKTLSFAAAVGGSLLDNARLFDQVRHLATTDPLTSLANYRSLSAVLESEIQRSGRTGRQFGVLLLDLDGLKKINDSYGHLVGDRALRRVADALRAVCRSMDLPARYAGDEFAVVLPESSEEAARRVAGRIRAQLAEDPDVPRLSVSVGAAVYPVDGTTLDALLAAADKSLYRMKAGREYQLAAS